MQVIYLSWKLNLHHSWNVSILFKLLNVPKIWVTFHFLMDIWFFHFWQWTVCCCEYLCRNILNSLGNKSRNEIGCSNHNSLTFEGWSNFFTVAKLFSICISNVLKLQFLYILTNFPLFSSFFLGFPLSLKVQCGSVIVAGTF